MPGEAHPGPTRRRARRERPVSFPGWSSHLLEKNPEKTAQIKNTIQVMNEAFPEALVRQYEDLVGGLKLPDPDDRHVLAAAIRGGANVIVTDNTRDFPLAILERHDLEARTADDFVLNALELHPADAVSAVKRMRERYTNPPHTPELLLQAMLRCGLVTAVAFLTPHVATL